jgi:hypothetical protein
MDTPDSQMLKNTSAAGDNMIVSRWAWALFAVLILAALAFDLGLFTGSRRRRKAKAA